MSASKWAPPLAAALAELASQYGEHIPPEVTRLFPKWKVELTAVICNQNPSQLHVVMEGIDTESAQADAMASVGFTFARSAVQAALDVHSSYGNMTLNAYQAMSHSPGGVPIFTNNGCAEPAILVEEMLERAPDAVRLTFPQFEAELRASVRRPIAELRAASARLESALIETEVSRFTDTCVYPDEVVAQEATALAFAVRALNELVHTKSAVAIAAAVAAACAPLEGTASSHRHSVMGVEEQIEFSAITTTRDGIGADSVTTTRTPRFVFRSLVPTHRPGDEFNPCCDEAKLERHAWAKLSDFHDGRREDRDDIEPPLKPMSPDQMEVDAFDMETLPVPLNTSSPLSLTPRDDTPDDAPVGNV